MDQSLAIRNIKMSLRILNVLLIATIVIISSCILLLFGLLVIALTVSGEKISKLVLDSNIDISFKFNGITVFLNKDIMSNFVYDKSETIVLIVFLTIFTVVIMSILVLLWKFVKSVIDGDVFTIKNSKRIELVGYSLLILSFLSNTVQAYLVSTVLHMFLNNNELENIEWIQSVSFRFLDINWSILLCGFIVWTIGRIFRYGSFLQEEYDATA
ncbi:hypothetical protein AMS59_00275 [Lysinibacillus sp. FJAT-14745]|uniref:DUF2975 domain-containing protein n=1 Tax=Lysinibacillus sp. FJAT-14745 TaxID=1704289 RepID=UPI0006ABC009|nr:DUF2975 domain-containing protein [Lysinibacillus sp. FJAT-14745]KOP80923.1 hypothetical protein AMS59_00275 [Lysinibacillus sp. FJAT-14745]